MNPDSPQYPDILGATFDGRGVDFALFSGSADAVELCLFDDPDDARESRRIPLKRGDAGLWRLRIQGLRPGQRYAYRVHGPWSPREGLRHNPAKLLLDPCARALAGTVPPDDILVASFVDPAAGDERPDPRDSAPVMPRCVVVHDQFDWRGDARPQTPWDRTVLYECHVRGTTIRCPRVDPPLRGTYLGLAAPPVIDHLRALGVTAVELLPIHAFATEPPLARRRLTNYWGYNPFAFFAPHARYASAPGRERDEFREMVRRLHAAGIEVILDVVYNHTAEGDHAGPMLSFRGIDNQAYYLLHPDDPARYLNFSGCGNTFNASHPAARRLILDSLRYWTAEMHVDGFRLDLAAALGRRPDGFDDQLELFSMIRDDPVLAESKFIVEPWDATPEGFRLGRFPPGISEWNSRFRDDVRRFWRGDPGFTPRIAMRLAGSSDLFDPATRAPTDGINYVACHDGFTLDDLVSYESKHNDANGEDNRDGPSENFSLNGGVEGPSTDPAVLQRRDRLKRSLLATLAFSRGVPMIAAGDEFGKTQQGNNNAYCQDNPISWLDWNLDHRRRSLLDFTRRIFRLRRELPALRADRFFTGQPITPQGPADVTWLSDAGREMSETDWHDPRRRSFAMLIAHPSGVPSSSVIYMALLFNADAEPRAFRLPAPCSDSFWIQLLNTESPDNPRPVTGELTLAPHALALLTAGAAATLSEPDATETCSVNS